MNKRKLPINQPGGRTRTPPPRAAEFRPSQWRTLATDKNAFLPPFRLCAILAQILSIYGLVVSVIMSGSIKEKMSLHTGFMQFGAGLSVGLCGLAAGFAIGIIGDAGGT